MVGAMIPTHEPPEPEVGGRFALHATVFFKVPTPMSILVLQHDAKEGPGLLGQVLLSYGHGLRVVELFAGQPLPGDLDEVDGILTLGGPMNCDEADRHAWMGGELALLKKAHEAGVPIVGVCLGHQLLAAALGGKVGPMAQPEVGWQPVRLAFAGTIDTLMQGIPWDTMQFHLHGQEVQTPPAGSAVLAGSRACKVQAFRVGMRSYGFQYHFEWSKSEVRAVAEDGFARRDAEAAGRIVPGIQEHYEGYRRLGERLSHNIAQYLMPLDKR